MELFQITPQTPIDIQNVQYIKLDWLFTGLCSVSDLHTFNDVLMFIL